MNRQIRVDIGMLSPKKVTEMFDKCIGLEGEALENHFKSYGCEMKYVNNILISIGYLGTKTCYLNISREEAIKRYLKDNPELTNSLDYYGIQIDEFEFGDEFECYAVYPKGN